MPSDIGVAWPKRDPYNDLSTIRGFVNYLQNWALIINELEYTWSLLREANHMLHDSVTHMGNTPPSSEPRLLRQITGTVVMTQQAKNAHNGH